MAVNEESILVEPNINPPTSNRRGVARPSSLLNVVGDGYLAGESPDGVTRVDGVPEPAQVRVLHRATGEVVAVVDSAQDGTWQVDRLNPRMKFDVVGRRDGFNDVIVAGVSPFTPAQLDGPARVQAHVGGSFQYEVKVFGGTGAAVVELASGTLPSGITYSDGVLSGMWPTGTPGDYPLTFDITDDGVTTQAVLTIEVVLRPFRFAVPPIPPELNRDDEIDSIQLVASGGEAPYSFAVVDGALPDGLSLSASGLLSGIPDTDGPYTFRIAATDARNTSLTREVAISVYKFTVTMSIIRIYITGNSGNSISYTGSQRIKVFDLNGVDLTGSGTASALSYHPSHPPEYAFDDDDPAHEWLTTGNQGYPTWIEYDFGEPVAVRAVSIKASSAVARSPKDFVIQAWAQETGWDDVLEVTGETGWTSNETRSWALVQGD